LISNLPGKSIKLIKFGQSLSRAFLKQGWVESGWLVALLVTVVEVVSANVLIVPFPTVDLVAIESLWSLAELDFLANFLSKGLACCCY
jgi:hypothetical protein